MNQRIKKSKENNNISGSTFGTGGYVVHHDGNTDPVVNVPERIIAVDSVGGPGGFAKASPIFKKIEEITHSTAEDEQKALASATIAVSGIVKK